MKSKHEPFLYKSQKKFGTHTSFNRADGERWCRAQGLASRPMANVGAARKGWARASQECVPN
jgi:hypothetical protein